MSFCKYKLINFGKGFINPSDITNGGFVLENGSNVSDMVFIGECSYEKDDNLPEHILSIHTEIQIKKIKKNNSKQKLDIYKKHQYTKLCDPLFMEAHREKLLGNDKKWNEYIKLCKKIKGLKKIGE